RRRHHGRQHRALLPRRRQGRRFEGFGSARAEEHARQEGARHPAKGRRLMALSDEDYAELEAAIASGQLDPAVAAQAKAALAGRGSVKPAPENSLGVTGIIQPGGEPELSPEDS